MTAQEKKLESRIPALVRENVQTACNLVDRLQTEDPTISESAVRHTIWRLVDCGQLAFTQNHTFELPKKRSGH